MQVHKRLALVTAAVALGAGLAGTVPAQAAQPSLSTQAATQRRDICFSGACGSATVHFQDRWRASVSMSVADNRCDKHAAEIRIIAHQWSYANQVGYTWKGPWRVNKLGCNKGPVPWNNKPFAGGDVLMGFKVEACVKGTSKCKTSSEMSNPY